MLVVDDNSDSAELLQLMLESNGYEVRIALAADEALGIVPDFLPDVALVDFGLPGTTGHELVLALRALPECAGCRCIAITGYTREQLGAEKLLAFDAHLLKPVNLSDVLGLLQRQL